MTKTEISNLLVSRRIMTKHFSLLSRGAGSALYRHYARRQCLICLREMLRLTDAQLSAMGTSRAVLRDLQDRLLAGELPVAGERPAVLAA